MQVSRPVEITLGIRLSIAKLLSEQCLGGETAVFFKCVKAWFKGGA